MTASTKCGEACGLIICRAVEQMGEEAAEGGDFFFNYLKLKENTISVFCSLQNIPNTDNKSCRSGRCIEAVFMYA
jgi:hypothetical protein